MVVTYVHQLLEVCVRSSPNHAFFYTWGHGDPTNGFCKVKLLLTWWTLQRSYGGSTQHVIKWYQMVISVFISLILWKGIIWHYSTYNAPSPWCRRFLRRFGCVRMAVPHLHSAGSGIESSHCTRQAITSSSKSQQDPALSLLIALDKPSLVAPNQRMNS